MHRLRGSSWQPRRALAVGQGATATEAPPSSSSHLGPLSPEAIHSWTGPHRRAPAELPEEESLALLPGDGGPAQVWFTVEC